MNHPNIATLHSLERDEEVHFLTMEFVEGDTLAVRLKSGALGLDEGIAIAHQVTCGLATAHRKDVVHRDLKPQNIMLTAEGRVKILDFGLARVAPQASAESFAEPGDTVELPREGETEAPPARENPSETTRSMSGLDSQGALVGTPGYMSPEQLRGERIDPKTDVFSFGCVLFECLTARRVFGGKSVWERIASTLEREPDLAELPEGISGAIRRLLIECLRKSAADRPTIDAVRQTIEKEIERRRVIEIRGEPDDPGTPVPNNLPRSPTPLIGRASQVAEVEEALAEQPLVTITGTGGSGKTRLAIEVARRQLASHPDGVWWVDLSGLSEATLLPGAVIEAVGADVLPNRTPTESLAEHFATHRILIVLDNCEHLIEPCAALVDTLLLRPSEGRVLVTTRESLTIDGEVCIALGALAVPEAGSDLAVESACDFSAIELFVERACRIERRFQLNASNLPAVVEVCRRLDGIPLAIELAAARVGMLSAQQIAHRLHQRFQILTRGQRRALPRHQTLRAAVDWSYELLDDEERTIFNRLAVFAGSFSLEAAEEVVWEADADRLNGLDLFSRLIDKSMVEMRSDDAGGARYSLLETMRAYANERLKESGEQAEIRRRHLEYFAALARRAAERGKGPEWTRWNERLAANLDNLRSILDRGVAGENAAEALSVAIDLGPFWELRGFWIEGDHYLRGLLNLEALSAPSEDRMKALRNAGKLSQYLGALDRARSQLSASLELARTLGDRHHEATALQTIGNVAEYRAEYDEAEACYTECLEIFQSLEDPEGIASARGNLGVVAKDRKQYERALEHYEASQAIFEQLDHLRGVAICLNNRGAVEQARGNADRAIGLTERALEIRRELGDQLGLATCLHNLGSLEIERGRFEAARALLDESLALKWSLGERYYIASTFEELARSAEAQGQSDRAGRLLHAARGLREQLGTPPPEDEREQLELLTNRLERELAPEAWKAARSWAEGVPIEKIVEYALEQGER